MAAKVVLDFIKMALFKKGGAIANDKAVKFSADALEKRLINLGIDPTTLNNQTELKQVLAYVKQMEDAAFDQRFSGIMKNKNPFKKEGEVIPFKQKRSFKEEIDAMKKSGDIVDVDDIKISEKITDREMFKNSNLNKPTIEGQMEKINAASKRLDELMKEREEMFKPKTDAEIKAKLEKQNKDSIKRLKKKKEDDPEFYTGGMVNVEPNLSDIGHGSDALMARTRLISPGAQGTTSTGLNYLLAEDNDNIRVPFSDAGFVNEALKDYNYYLNLRKSRPSKSSKEIPFRKFFELYSKENRAEGGRIGFSKGKIAKEIVDKGRRGFMKAAGAAGAGIAALKTGLLGFGKEAAPVVEKVAETVSETAQSVPPYFFRLVEKIRAMGDDTIASQDKTIAKKYKDYIMEEDFSGNITIVKSGEDLEGNKLEDVYMSYKVDDKSIPNKKGFAKVEEYEEFTAKPDMEGKMKDIEQGVPDEVVQEGTMFEDNMTEFGKADGGRIGFSKGKLVLENAAKFLQKIFGKENMAEMPNRDPEMYQGMLEVVDMFRNRDTEGLIKYMQKFLPHMGKKEVQAFIKGDAEDMAGLGKFGLGNLQGQLIRLGSGRDYAGKIEAFKKLENAQKLKTLEVTEDMKRKPNASGGLAKMLGE